MTIFAEYQRLYVTCDCHDILHQVVFEYDDQEPYDLQIFPMLISERPWYKRILPGLAYIFGWKGKNHWHYTDIMVSASTAQEIQKFIDQFQADRDAFFDFKNGNSDTYVPLRGFSMPGAR